MPPRKLTKDSISSELIDGAGTFNPPKSTLPVDEPIKTNTDVPYHTDAGTGAIPWADIRSRHLDEPSIYGSDIASFITAINAISDANLAPLRLEVLHLALTKAKALLA